MFSILGIIGFICLALQPRIARGDFEVPAEAIEAWRTYASRLRTATWEGRFTRTETILKGKDRSPGRPMVFWHRYTTSPDGWAFLYKDGDIWDKKETSARVYGGNPQYIFMLDPRISGLSLSKLHMDEKAEKAYMVTTGRETGDEVLMRLCAIGGKPLDQLADSLRVVDESDKNGRVTLKATRPILIGTKKNSETHGDLEVVVNPNKFWAVESVSYSSSTITDNIPFVADCKYDFESAVIDGVPLLTKEVMTRRVRRADTGGVVVIRSVATISVKPDPDVDPEKFRLSGYGIPEPSGVSWERPTAWYIWLLAAIACGALLARVFSYASRRARRAQAPGDTE